MADARLSRAVRVTEICLGSASGPIVGGVRAILFCGVFVLTACGGSTPEPVQAPLPPAPVAAKAPVPSGPLTTLKRHDIAKVVDEGFGTFLGRVQVEPSLDAGRFRGWTIVELTPKAFWDAVDLQPGDVVTSVNGLPIERDVQAWEAFQSLKTADELAVAYYRAGAARKLAYRIVE